MKKIIFTLFISLTAGLIQAQTITLDWVKKIGGASFDEAYAVAVDPSGNIFIAGSFTGIVDFDPSPTKTFYITSASLSQDIFVCKLDAKGNFIWAKGMGGDFEESALTMAVDAEGAVYAAGFFQDFGDFDPGKQGYNMGSAGLDDIFISKLDADGNFIWAKRIGGTGYDYVNSMSLKNNVIYLAGTFQSTVDFDPSGNTTNLTSSGEFDIHVIKLDTAGKYIWAKAMGGVYSDGANSVSIDASENIYTTGFYQDDADFDPSNTIYTLKSQGGTEIFISKLDSSGKFVWAKRIGATSDDQALSIVSDDLGNVYTTGFFIGTVDFNPGPPKYDMTAAGGADAYVVKLDAKGNFAWAKQISGKGTELGNSITLDKFGNLYSTGYFDSTVDFDPGASVYNITSHNSLDIFVYKFDTSGNFKWAYSFGGTQTELGQSIITDKFGDVYTVGYFSDTANFGIDTAQTNQLISGGSSDMFIHKIKQCAASNADTNIQACYNVKLNNKNYDSTGIYYDTIANVRGCDSLITLHITIDKIDTAVIKNGNILTAKATGKTYQWIDCNKNYTPIAGQTSQSFKPVLNGDYAVIITFGNCTYTTICHNINNAGIAEQNQNYIQIFPNPTQGNFTINFSNIRRGEQNATLKIYNITGQVVLYKNNISGDSFNTNISEFGEGIYLLELTDYNGSWFKKIVVKE
ncbi:MAG: T9SS type A sorting domain-containing protein [Bacteroidota bacterium]|nr:T9SS type A sorting domain-containing protein [Bacteroidota bacterium]